MRKKSINEIVSEALKFYMGDRWNQSTLGVKAGVSPGTVKNCLAPDLRVRSATGKEPSVKLTELDHIAAALSIPIADLVTDMTPDERAKSLQRRAGDFVAEHGRMPDWYQEPPPPNGISKPPRKAA